jgi:thiol-disulfide isomerase/thioredoxin
MTNERFSNAPPQMTPSDKQYPSNQIRSVIQTPQNVPPSQPRPIQSQQGQPQGQPQSQQGQPQGQPQPHGRVRMIPTDKMYELLANPAHFAVQNQPLRLFIKVSTTWCKPCTIIAPRIQELSMDPAYANVLFLEVDGDELVKDERLSSKLLVSAVPSFFGFVGGKQIGRSAGTDMSEIRGLCDKIASSR